MAGQGKFTNYMSGMLEHYQDNPSHSYALPLNLHGTSVIDAEPISEEAKADLKAALKFAEEQMLAFINEQGQHLQSVVHKLNTDATGGGLQAAAMTTAQFVAQMKAYEAEAQKKSNQQLSAAYDKLIAVGEKHPPAQPIILQKTAAVSGQSANILNSLNAIYGGLGSFGGDVVKGAEAAGNWVSGAAKSVGHFFSGLFG